TASRDDTSRLWDAASGDALAVLQGHSDNVVSVAFSPDGTRLATASWDKTARLWDAASGEALAALRGHSREVFSAAFSPDGTRLATTSWDKTARLWHAASGEALAVLEGHSDGVPSVAFSPDGTRLATASEDDTARLWRVFRTTQDLIDAAKEELPRCLTPDQRAQFYLPPEPERWCVTGAGREAEPDPTQWRPLRPYHTDAWRDSLLAKDRGEEPELPTQ
ncbi:MAG: WD40 repeat domain-containing protein, partial [Pseudomonadota bacterium]